MSDSIVITGAGLVTPLGTGRDSVWQALLAGESGVRQLLDDDPRLARGVDPDRRMRAVFGGFVKGFQPREIIRSRQLRRMDWISRLITASTRLAVADAAAEETIAAAPTRVAIVAGSCFGPQRETQEYMDRVLERGIGSGQPFLFPNLVLNAASGWAAIELGVQGPNLMVSAHEASGEIAIVTALDLLQADQVDLVIACAAEEFGDVLTGALHDLRLLDPRCLPEGGADGPQHDHIVPGEGGAALVLERESRARERGQRPLATLADATSFATEGARAHSFSRAAETTADIAQWLGSRRPRALVGGTAGGRARSALDDALRATLGVDRFIGLRDSVGESASAGVLAAALAALACSSGRWPGLAIDTPTRQAPTFGDGILVVGAGRSGLVAPLLITSAPPA
jgi:3-oxoacyl-[acyl-carrier-protein] synthase II